MVRHRSDIQGLRAVAVLLVALGHAGVPGLTGGYVGVDVFFVLSGFLITGLLSSEALETGRVSLVRFYVRRARRILPAAALTLVVTTIAAQHLLNFVRARDVVTDSIWAAFFAANVHFAALRERLLPAGTAAVAAPALLVALGRGAVLPRVAVAARARAVRARSRARAAWPAAARDRRCGSRIAGLVDPRHRRDAGLRVLLDARPRVGARARSGPRRRRAHARAPPRVRPRRARLGRPRQRSRAPPLSSPPAPPFPATRRFCRRSAPRS